MGIRKVAEHESVRGPYIPKSWDWFEWRPSPDFNWEGLYQRIDDMCVDQDREIIDSTWSWEIEGTDEEYRKYTGLLEAF